MSQQNEFVIESIAAYTEKVSSMHYPLKRSADLRRIFTEIFRGHLGNLRGGHRFETEPILVTGPSGAGKSGEIRELLKHFNASGVLLPDGQRARFVECILDSNMSWKDLGRVTAEAMGYPIPEHSRLTVTMIWKRVAQQAKLQGIVGIHYDEAQHILSHKSDKERAVIVDAFKTLSKLKDWPLMLILSGVPELADHIGNAEQLDRLGSWIQFEDIDLSPAADGAMAADFAVIHDIVGNYAIKAGIEVGEDIRNRDFYHRLAVAASYRWGLLFKITCFAIAKAVEEGAVSLTPDHFIASYRKWSKSSPAATPFTHSAFESMFPRDTPFRSRIAA